MDICERSSVICGLVRQSGRCKIVKVRFPIRSEPAQGRTLNKVGPIYGDRSMPYYDLPLLKTAIFESHVVTHASDTLAFL